MKGNLIFSIKLGQRLPKSFSQLHVKYSRFFLSYFLKKDRRHTPAQGCRLSPTVTLRISLYSFCIARLHSEIFSCFNHRICLLYEQQNFWLTEQNFVVNNIWLIIPIILVEPTKYLVGSAQYDG